MFCAAFSFWRLWFFAFFRLFGCGFPWFPIMVIWRQMYGQESTGNALLIKERICWAICWQAWNEEGASDGAARPTACHCPSLLRRLQLRCPIAPIGLIIGPGLWLTLAFRSGSTSRDLAATSAIFKPSSLGEGMLQKPSVFSPCRPTGLKPWRRPICKRVIKKNGKMGDKMRLNSF